MATWTVGTKAYYFPEETGMMWGTNDPHYIVLEMHFTNNFGIGEQFDTSGMRVYYTSRLRKYDINVIGFCGSVGGIRLQEKKGITLDNLPCFIQCENYEE